MANPDAKRYYAWQALLFETWEPSEGLSKTVAVAYACALTRGTDFGKTCYRSKTEIGKHIGKHRHTLERYEKALIKDGYLIKTGVKRGYQGQIEELAIAIPGEVVSVTDEPTAPTAARAKTHEPCKCGSTKAPVREEIPGYGTTETCPVCGSGRKV